MSDDTIQVLDEKSRWRARGVCYWSGKWEKLSSQLPVFKTADFQAAEDAPANPYLKTVVRLPRTLVEKPIPVGVVSHTYTLAQHSDIAEKCLQGLRSAGIKTDSLRCELGLTELGEWMNLRVYFPERYNHTPFDGNPIRLRLECMNSVDGSSRLIILLSWLRLICTNGMVIRETKTEIRDIHNENLDLERIPQVIEDAMTLVEDDLRRLSGWEKARLDAERFRLWVNEKLAERWGKKAACRVFHICTSGFDVEIADPFAGGDPSDKPTKRIRRVPGAPENARNLYDVSQALSWIASGRNNAEERLEWQSSIPDLIHGLLAA